MQFLKPFIEFFDARAPIDASGYREVGFDEAIHRRALSRKFLNIYNKEPFSESFYGCLSVVMRKIPRLALYLPIDWLDKAPGHFMSAYLNHWQRCWYMQDARENFNLGDIYEPEARIGELEYVVKAMHLLPELVRIGYLDDDDIIRIVKHVRHDDPLICHSLLDAISVLRDQSLIEQETAEQVLHMTRNLSPRLAPPRLAFVTEKRKAWLKEMAEDYRIEPSNISGPFSNNLSEELLLEISKQRPNEIAIIGGSRLKGYARVDSDYDLFWLNPITGEISGGYSSSIGKANPNIIHLLMDTVWATANNGIDLRAARNGALKPYFKLPPDAPERGMCLSRLEADLVQYRLMHKGFIHTHEAQPNWLARYTVIDGASAFYDDRYREIATIILISCLDLPTIKA